MKVWSVDIDVEVDVNSIYIVFDWILDYGFGIIIISGGMTINFLVCFYIGHLFKRLVICSILLVLVSSEVTIAIIFILITESDPGAIAVLVSSSNRSSLLSNEL